VSVVSRDGYVEFKNYFGNFRDELRVFSSTPGKFVVCDWLLLVLRTATRALVTIASLQGYFRAKTLVVDHFSVAGREACPLWD